MNYVYQRWYVYMLLCTDDTLYTGISTNVAKRVETHNKGDGAKYTRGRIPVRLLANTGPMLESRARRLEIAIKKLSREDKLSRIKEDGWIINAESK